MVLVRLLDFVRKKIFGKDRGKTKYFNTEILSDVLKKHFIAEENV